ncbi:MAG: hypothetical protein AAFO91_18445, partial [Bacteroidota bacterium]
MSQHTVNKPEPITTTETPGVNDLFTGDDTQFSAGYAFERDGNTEQALNAYEAALSAGNLNFAQEAHVRYRMARLERENDPLKAVEIFKEIIANPVYPDVQKRYAAMRLPLLISSTGDPEVKAAVLSGTPYASFADQDNFTTYKNLYEFSLEFGSSGIADFNVARWYAKQLVEDETLDATTVAEYEELIESLFESGNDFVI